MWLAVLYLMWLAVLYLMWLAVLYLIPNDVLYLVPVYRAETLMSILHSNTCCQIFASYILNHALTPHDLEPVEPSREGAMWPVESEGGMWSLESERAMSSSCLPTATNDDLNSSNSSNSLLHDGQESNAAANQPRITCLPRNTDRGGSRWLETEDRHANLYLSRQRSDRGATHVKTSLASTSQTSLGCGQTSKH